MHTELSSFIAATEAAIASAPSEAALIETVDLALKRLISSKEWLPSAWREPDPKSYRQLPLYIDPQGRFSVISFVWGPGQSTPVHNHTTWGIVGMLEGAELCKEYAPPQNGRIGEFLGEHRLEVGQTDIVSPSLGDWHQVSNAIADKASVSIHVYGADIGKVERSAIDPSTQNVRAFVSGYSSSTPASVN